MRIFPQSFNFFKARNLITICLIFLFFCVSIISTLFYSTSEEKKNLAIINREYYGQSMQTVCVKPNDETALPATVYDIKNILPKNSNCAVYFNDDKHIRQIYYQGDFNAPPVISGRFFKPDDFSENKNIAVVGKNRTDEIFELKNKKYIKYQEQNFEVVGIVGTEKSSVLNSTEFVSCGKNIATTTPVFTLDINQSNSEELIKNIEDGLDDKGFILSRMNAPTNAYIALNQNDVGTNIILFALICFALSILIISIEWINYFSSQITIERLLGFKFFIIFSRVFLKYFSFAGIGIIIASIVEILTGNFNSLTLLFSVIVTFITAILVFIPSAIKLSKVSFMEALG